MWCGVVVTYITLWRNITVSSQSMLDCSCICHKRDHGCSVITSVNDHFHYELLLQLGVYVFSGKVHDDVDGAIDGFYCIGNIMGFKYSI